MSSLYPCRGDRITRSEIAPHAALSDRIFGERAIALFTKILRGDRTESFTLSLARDNG